MTTHHRGKYVAAVAVAVVIAAPVALGVGAPAFADTQVETWAELRAAFAAVPLGGSATVVLGADIEAGSGEGLVVPHADGGEGASVTLDLNGHGLRIPRPDSTRYGAGIGVYSGASLTIDDSGGEGRLWATGNDWGAGIGADSTDRDHGGRGLGRIVIAGGAVKADGGKGAAGIGNASYATGGSVTVTGGRVDATGGYEAAGIGGSYYAGYKSDAPLSAAISLLGGSVHAVGGESGAGIGGGYTAVGSDIVIENASVSAVGGHDAAAIGTGPFNGYYPTHRAGSVVIRSSTVIATGGGMGAGIGGGREAHAPTVTIEDSHIDAQGGTGSAAGIGGGREALSSAAIDIIGSTVTAHGAEAPDGYGLMGGAGIGGGLGTASYAGSTISIDDSVVEAFGGGQAAGIGGGAHRTPISSDYSSVESVVITGSRVTAHGGRYAAGIGGGEEQNGAAVTIGAGSAVTSIGGYGDNWGSSGAGIGSGRSGESIVPSPGSIQLGGKLAAGASTGGGNGFRSGPEHMERGGRAATIEPRTEGGTGSFAVTAVDGSDRSTAGRVTIDYVQETDTPGDSPGAPDGLLVANPEWPDQSAPPPVAAVDSPAAEDSTPAEDAGAPSAGSTPSPEGPTPPGVDESRTDPARPESMRGESS